VQTDERGSAISILSAYINELFVLLLELLREEKAALNPSLTLRAAPPKCF
jgi:hypothetical protein